MWLTACEAIDRSIHPLIARRLSPTGTPYWCTVGTAFLISQVDNPTFLTCAHVVCSPYGTVRGDLAVIPMIPGTDGKPAGVSVMDMALELDLAVLEASSEAEWIPQAVLSGAPPPACGEPVASMGFPIPSPPDFDAAGGKLVLQKRFSAGFMSNPSVSTWLEGAPSVRRDLPHCELNLFSYPGLSGAPVFDLAARVVGINRGSGRHRDQVAAYSYAVPGAQIKQYLERIGLGHRVPVDAV